MHTHVNWGFTAAGEYLVTLNVNGETENDGAFTNSATFRFLVEDQSHVLPRFGDLTGDGVVDRGDLATLSQAFGTTSAATSATGDLDGDGRVGLRDLVLLRNEIGGLAAPSSTTAPFPSTSPTIESQGGAIGELMTALGASLNSSSVAAAAVPEPSTLALAGCGVLAAGWISRRRARK
jgi:surface-anchored protein